MPTRHRKLKVSDLTSKHLIGYAVRRKTEDGVVPATIYEPGELAAALPGLRRAAAGQRVAFFLLYEGSLYPAHPWLDAAVSPARRVIEVPRGAGEKFTLYRFEVGGTDVLPARL